MENLGVTRISRSAAHESHKPTTDTPQHSGGLAISFTEYVKELSLINLPSHSRRERKPTPLKLSKLRARYAKFATVVGASVAVDGASTAS